MIDLHIFVKCASFLYINLNFWTILTILIALSFWRLRKPHSRFPPGPLGYPVLGVLPQLVQDQEKSIKRWIAQYGSIMCVPLPIGHIVYLNSFESVTEAFLKQGSKFSGRPYLFSVGQITLDHGLIFKSYGEDYKVQRKFGNKVLRDIGFGGNRMAEVINREAEFLVNHLKSKTGHPYDMKSDIYNITANIISAVVLGQRYDYDDPKFRKILWSSERSFSEPQDKTRMNIMMLFPWLRYFPYFKDANKRLINNQMLLLDLAKIIVYEHKKKFDVENLKDFIDFYLFEQMHGTSKNKEKFNDEELVAYVRDLFFAGTETSSNTISWAILILLHYPHFTKILEDEINHVLGFDVLPTLLHKSKMPFTCAFIQEVLRFRALIPTGVAHCTTESAELFNYHIPKGTWVLANINYINHDPQTWTHPEEFNPYRHIDKDGSFVFSPKIITFSVGPRICLGEQLARMEIFLIFVTLLQNFKISKDSNSALPSLDERSSDILIAPLRYKVILEERL